MTRVDSALVEASHPLGTVLPMNIDEDPKTE